LGSIAEEVFRMAPCPVLTVGPKTLPLSTERQIRHVLYLVEYVPDTSKAAAYALSLADQYGSILTVMNVREDMAGTATDWFEPEREHWIQQHLTDKSDLRNRVRFHMGFGAAAESILEYTANSNVDVIVMSVRQLDPFMAAHLPRSYQSPDNREVARVPPSLAEKIPDLLCRGLGPESDPEESDPLSHDQPWLALAR